jgi:CBS domain containing-hemolysin-like protein
MLPIVLITCVSLVGSFFCSLLEACIYSVSRTRIESLRREGHPSGERLALIRANVDEAIAAILILNTVANSGGAAWAGALVSKQFGDTSLGVFSAVFIFAALFTTSVLLFSEIVPKSIGVQFANSVAPAISLPLRWLIVLLWPAVRVCVAVTRLWGSNSHISHATEDDIINLARLGGRHGQILPQEAQWVANALRLNDVTAYDLMTPNTVVARVLETDSLENTRIDAQHWRFSRLPVCRDDNPDEIVGIVHRAKVFDALAKDEFDRTVRDLMLPADFVSDGTPANELLDDFLGKRRHLFCVVNDSGAFIGVVSLEDVVECLLGAEIVDESDLHEDMQEVARQRRRRLLKESRELIRTQEEERER